MKNLGLIIILVPTLLFGQNYNLKDFKKNKIPNSSFLFPSFKVNEISLADSFKQLHETRKESWEISKFHDSIKISKYVYNKTLKDSLPFKKDFISKKLNTNYYINAIKKLNDGYIIGCNSGEFGGGLWFLSLDGENSYEIAPFNRVLQIFEFNKKIYFTEGLSHLGTSRGRIIEIKKNLNKWNIFREYKLPDAPKVIKQEDNNLLILTSEHLMIFDNKKLTKILKAPFYWGVLNPNSIVIKNSDIYIGMIKGILKISNFRESPKYKWYIKK